MNGKKCKRGSGPNGSLEPDEQKQPDISGRRPKYQVSKTKAVISKKSHEQGQCWENLKHGQLNCHKTTGSLMDISTRRPTNISGEKKENSINKYHG